MKIGFMTNWFYPKFQMKFYLEVEFLKSKNSFYYMFCLIFSYNAIHKYKVKRDRITWVHALIG